MLAETVVDLYGANDQVSELILKKYGDKIASIEGRIMDEIKHQPNDFDTKKIKNVIASRLALLKKIKQEFGFLYIEFNSIMYPMDDEKYYTTIDVVSNKDPDRLRFVGPKRTVNAVTVSEKNRQNVVDDMLIYMRINDAIVLNADVGAKNNICPVYHCLSGFNDKALKPYLEIFNTGVNQEKKLILETISNKGMDTERRVAAVYLLGHLRDPNEIISLLGPYVHDQYSDVRNASMRVIGETIAKANISSFDIMPFLDLLDSPFTTDRNKALYILIKAADSKKTKNLIIQKGGDRLVSILHLRQPNNHGMAYILLREISGKEFAETNMEAWNNWLSGVKSLPA